VIIFHCSCRFLSSYPLYYICGLAHKKRLCYAMKQRPRNFPSLVPPASHTRQKFLSKVRGVISRVKADTRRASRRRGVIAFRPYIFSVAPGQHSPPRYAAPSRVLLWPLFSFAFLPVLVFPFAHQRRIAPVRAHFNCARHRAISR